MTASLRGLSISVVGIYYAPDSTGIAPYTTDLCETLAAAGATVRAVVGVPHYPQWTVEPAYRRRLRSQDRVGGVDVTRVRHYVPRSQDVLRRGLYELSFLAAAGMALRGHRPDLVLGVTPNLAGAAAAAALAGRRRVPLGVVVQDLVGLGARQSGIRGGAGMADRIARLEAGVLRRADRIAVITDAFLRPLVDSGVDADRIDLLPNYVHCTASDASRLEARAALSWPADRPIAVHAGNMGLKQGLDSVVDAARLADARGSDLLIVLVGDGSTRRRLEQRGAGLRTLRFLDPLPADRFPLALAAADCLLLNERATVVDMSMPSKLTSYLAAGRPVVAATHPTSAAAAEVRRAGAGEIVRPGDPDALLLAVERMTRDPARAERAGAAGRSYAVQHLSRAAARRRIVEFVAGAGTRRPGNAGSPDPEEVVDLPAAKEPTS